MNRIKRFSAAYKSKADGIIKGLKDLEDSADKLQGQILDQLGDFQDKAREIDHEDIVKDIQSLKKSL